MQRDDTPRALPNAYPDRGRWRVVLKGRLEGDDRRRYRFFDSKKKAEQYIQDFNQAIQEKANLALDSALGRYLDYKKGQGLKPRTLETLSYRVRSFFSEKLHDRKVSAITPALCQSAYNDLVERQEAATHHAMLREMKAFFAWLLKEGYLLANPIQAIERQGKARRGKAQLRLSEAKKLYSLCETIIAALDLPDPIPVLARYELRPPAWYHGPSQLPRYRRKVMSGVTAALSALVLGLRTEEIVTRKIRDLDEEGTLLWVGDADLDDVKNERSIRLLEVPELLTPYLMAIAQGRGPEDPLFADLDPKRTTPQYDRRWVCYWAKRLAALAGVKVVTAHGLRGTSSSIARAQGAPQALVAAAFGHSEEVNRTHYTLPEASANGRTKRILNVLKGGVS